MAAKMKMKKGDRVMVITGKDKGKTGDILRMFPEDNRAIVQGVNMIKRHTRPTQSNVGGIIEREASIHISNLGHIDPKSDKPTRVGYRFLKDGKKVRYAKGSGEVIDL